MFANTWKVLRPTPSLPTQLSWVYAGPLSSGIMYLYEFCGGEYWTGERDVVVLFGYSLKYTQEKNTYLHEHNFS